MLLNCLGDGAGNNVELYRYEGSGKCIMRTVFTLRSLRTWLPTKVPPWYACLLILQTFRLSSKVAKKGPSLMVLFMSKNFRFSVVSNLDNSVDYSGKT
jgi:hypothetical protein